MIPWWAKALVLAAVVGFIFGAGWWSRSVLADRDAAKFKEQAALERAESVAQANKLADERMRETERRLAAQKGIADETARTLARERDARATADLVARSLHERAAALAAASDARECNPAAPAERQAAGPDARVFADLFRRADEAAGRMAEVAGQRYAAGLDCQQRYDTLTENRAP